MSKPKTYKMRPTKSLPNGRGFVPVLYKVLPTGQPQYLTGEGEHEVTPDVLRAYKAGDCEIDGYGEEAKSKPKKKRKARKPKEEASEQPAPEPTEEPSKQEP